MPIGIMDQVNAFTSDDMIQFYKKWYRLDSMCVIVAGDIVPEDVDKMIQIVFENDADDDGVRTKIGTEETLSQLFSDGNDRGTQLPAVVSEIIKDSDGAVCPYVRSGTAYSSDLFVLWLKRPTRSRLPDQTSILFKPVQQREVVFQHDLIRMVSITIAALFPLVPLVDEREAFVSFIDATASHVRSSNK